MENEITFDSFALHESVKEALDAMGFKKPTPIQQKALPLILEGKDLIGCAQTGTGKTAAFLLPIISKIASREEPSESINTLIITPTRELASQIDQQLEGLGYFSGVSSIAVYGGGDGSVFDKEKKALTKGADVVICTPGRFISHLNLGYVKIEDLEHLILDEADRMLDMGFHDDIMRIISFLPPDRQTLLFSATMPPKIRDLAKSTLKNPEEINIAISKPAEGVVQAAFSVYDSQKVPLIVHLLQARNITSGIIFCSTKSSVKVLDRELRQKGVKCAAIHSDLDQMEREAMLLEFRNRNINVLVATDILARGIDITGIELVLNHDVPGDAEDYIHRVGRTARAATKGVAFTLINENDQRKFQSIEKLLEKEILKVKLPAFLGEGPEYNPSIRRNDGGGFRGKRSGQQKGGFRKGRPKSK
jgi:ATP-dependent RNA helicase RhlE